MHSEQIKTDVSGKITNLDKMWPYIANNSDPELLVQIKSQKPLWPLY